MFDHAPIVSCKRIIQQSDVDKMSRLTERRYSPTPYLLTTERRGSVDWPTESINRDHTHELILRWIAHRTRSTFNVQSVREIHSGREIRKIITERSLYDPNRAERSRWLRESKQSLAARARVTHVACPSAGRSSPVVVGEPNSNSFYTTIGFL